jgi:hypothetical protein
MLTDAQIDDFIASGFVRLDHAFPHELADAGRTILWREMGLDPDDPAAWTQPVVRLGMYGGSPWVEAANAPRLTAAYDQLAGPGRWIAPRALGTFVVRFPAAEGANDEGWHIDVSFGDGPDFMEWRANVMSRGRALLMLFLFSDVGENDGPTRIRKGSHADVARMLAPAGEAGLSLRELVARLPETAHCEETLATGPAGTVYLCHPFLVHAAQRNSGIRPRFLAQPPLMPREELRLEREDGAHSPVERAIRQAIGLAPSA